MADTNETASPLSKETADLTLTSPPTSTQPAPPHPTLQPFSSTTFTTPSSITAPLAPYLPSTTITTTTTSPSTASSTTIPIHLTLTYATSLDAQLTLHPGLPTPLSGPVSMGLTHHIRAQHSAILVGAGTALSDDPSLTCRDTSAASRSVEEWPLPVILDPGARWHASAESRVCRAAVEGRGRWPLWIVGAGKGVEREGFEERRKRVVDSGGAVVGIVGLKDYEGGGGVDWSKVLDVLAERGVTSVMVEGGGTVIRDLLRKRNQSYVTSVLVTLAPIWLGGGGVWTAPEREGEGEVGRLDDVVWVGLGKDVMMAGRFARRVGGEEV